MMVRGAVTKVLKRICSARVGVAVPILQPINEYAEHAFSELNAPKNLIVYPMALEGFLPDQHAGDRGTSQTVVDQLLYASFAFCLGFLSQGPVEVTRRLAIILCDPVVAHLVYAPNIALIVKAEKDAPQRLGGARKQRARRPTQQTTTICRSKGGSGHEPVLQASNRKAASAP